ncbi:MAG: alpha-amylase family glycosyl hydrolase, partial [Kiritimatiellia bacterium]
MDTSRFSWRKIGLAAVLAGAMASSALGEAMLQYFNTSWKEITDRMPELAEAGYSSLWLPPPTKGSGGLSVGYDLWDPFDLGGRHQRSTVATRYGTEAELLNLVETAHRFGIRVYFDNIMNHRAFDIPAYNESTPADVYPGMAPEDFHLRRTPDGFYRKWDNCRDWNDAWQVLHLGLSDLIDIAHESPNQNHGAKEGDWHPKPSFVRHPDHPEFYDRMPNTNQPPEYSDPWDWSSGTSSNVYVGFGTNNGITAELIAQYPAFYSEDVGGYLMRAARWLMDRTRADGLRLDAVKHVPDYFFGEFGADASHLGYCGNVQWQFNMTRGFSDWDNHRDSNFNTEIPRDDAILFGEHLGQPPGYDGYISAGMRLVDNDLRNELNWRFSANNLWGFDNAGAGGFAPNVGVMHAQSHDNDFVDRKEAHHAYYFLRGGLGLLYTDGNHHAETLGESGGAFPRWANTAFLGQWGQTHIPELLKIHENFARYDHIGYGTHWDGASIAWERGGTFPSNTMLVVFNSRWEDWLTVPTKGSYPDDIYLYNYAQTYPCYFKDSGPRADYVYASDIYNVNQPPHSYSVWGIKNPDPSSLWPGGVISIYDDGALADTVAVERKDGPDGDAEFNPYGHLNRGYPEGVEPAPYSYRQTLPRITKGSNVV